MPENSTVVALIPARAGSKRLAGKNVKPLAGHSLLAYTIAAALQSRVFADVIVSTESEEYAAIARHYGAGVPFPRPPEIAGDLSPDIEWVEYTLAKLREAGREYGCFSILRPTSPFRRAETIQRAWQEFMAQGEADSLRAVEKCSQHPGKMWVVQGNLMRPLLPQEPGGTPTHSRPYQDLPEVYVQNASLEIARARVVFEGHSIAGDRVMPFFTQGHEGFDVNQPIDWQIAEELVRTGRAVLPEVTQKPYPFKEAPQ